MAKVVLYNMDCLEAMGRIADGSVDCVLTSPPYVTSTHTSEAKPHTLTDVKSKGYPWLRYDVFNDTMSNEDFADWQSRIFRELDRILKPNGCVIYNISYSAGNTTCWIDAVYQIIHNSPFTMADKIVWKKKCALPNNHSPSQLTRICEDIFVFCRAKERTTFHCNKRVVSVTAHGQNNYENVMNFVEAGNNDGANDLNKATFSTELAHRLLKFYCRSPKDGGTLVFDPFMGTGTTASAARDLGLDCIGAELSAAQCEYAYKRLGGGGMDFFTDVEIIKPDSTGDGKMEVIEK